LSNIVEHLLTQKVTLKKVTVSGGTDVWGEPTETVSEYLIDAYIVPLTVEDLRYLSPGVYSFGDMRGYFLQEYQVEVGKVQVRSGDRIIFNNNEYIVETIVDYVWNEIRFREAYLRKVVG